MGRRFPDGGLLRYRKWVPQQLGDVNKQGSGDSQLMRAQHGDMAANHTDLQSGCGWTCVFAVQAWSNLWDLISEPPSHYSMGYKCFYNGENSPINDACATHMRNRLNRISFSPHQYPQCTATSTGGSVNMKVCVDPIKTFQTASCCCKQQYKCSTAQYCTQCTVSPSPASIMWKCHLQTKENLSASLPTPAQPRPSPVKTPRMKR